MESGDRMAVIQADEGVDRRGFCKQMCSRLLEFFGEEDSFG
jgi:hypothetical protein